jgi:TIR domain
MAKVIFLSHAGFDALKATAVAHELQCAGIDVRFDRQELCLGDGFLTFMDQALSTSDYCLLLWSRHAAAVQWVRMEWEAALYRSVQEKRSFLVAGLLEDFPLPALIAPRLRTDLFPELQPGLGRIIDTWQADRVAEHQTQRPVASAPLSKASVPGTSTIYVTSEAFGITTPLGANLDEPAGLYLDRIVDVFKLPKVFDHDGRIGVRFGYRLKLGSKTLERGLALTAQQVTDRSVLWLETTMTPYAQSDPMAGSIHPATFRHIDFNARPHPVKAAGGLLGMEGSEAESGARKALEQAVVCCGMGPP